MITGISGFGFFGPKMAVSWRICFLQKKFAETPIFIVFLGCALFGPSCQKGKFWTPTQKRKKLTDNWKAHFWVFFGFSCFFFFFFFFVFFCMFCCFLCFFGGFKGHVRWPEGPPHLALNPPYLFFLFVLFFFGFFLVPFLSLGHLIGPKTLFFLFVKKFFLSAFLFFIFECLPFFLHSLFWPPPFSLFLSLSFSLFWASFSFFLSSSFLSFFFASFGFLFLSLSFFWFLLCFCFMKGTTSKYSITKFLFINPFSFLLVSSLLFSFKSPFLIFVFFPAFKFCFFNINVFLKKCKFKKKTPIFGQEGGCNITVFFYQPVFCKMWKVIVFGGAFFANFCCFQKKHYKIGILAHFSKQKLQKKGYILESYYLVQVGVIIWSKLGALKNANLDQIITL